MRPRLRDKAHEIVAVGAPMSCVPGEGRLWTAVTTNGGWVIAWEKFRAGRVKREIIEAVGGGTPTLPTTPLTVGRALRASCDDVATCLIGSDPIRQVNHQGGSGSAPQIDSISAQIEFFPNGDFITRSNEVEWVYRRINPGENFGLQQSLSDGAKVTFAGDGASNLADPTDGDICPPLAEDE